MAFDRLMPPSLPKKIWFVNFQGLSASSAKPEPCHTKPGRPRNSTGILRIAAFVSLLEVVISHAESARREIFSSCRLRAISVGGLRRPCQVLQLHGAKHLLLTLPSRQVAANNLSSSVPDKTYTKCLAIRERVLWSRPNIIAEALEHWCVMFDHNPVELFAVFVDDSLAVWRSKTLLP
jgi:hypothetical protein